MSQQQEQAQQQQPDNTLTSHRTDGGTKHIYSLLKKLQNTGNVTAQDIGGII